MQSSFRYKSIFSNSPGSSDALPENEEELDLHMQLSYKQSVEIAEEEVINNTFRKK